MVRHTMSLNYLLPDQTIIAYRYNGIKLIHLSPLLYEDCIILRRKKTVTNICGSRLVVERGKIINKA